MESVWLQITAGQGPKECAWVVAQLKRVILKAAIDAQLDVTCIDALAFDKFLRHQNDIEADAYLSVLLYLEGDQALAFGEYWHGTIKWQGVSPYRPKHKRCNWFVGVTLLSLPHEQRVELDQFAKGVTFESMRSRGAGGQHVNKTNSAVRATHIETGLQVKVDTDRSQHRNKKIALERLYLLFCEKYNVQQKNTEEYRWQQHWQVQRGNPKHVFSGEGFVAT